MTPLRRTIKKSRLVEISFVSVGMNPHALVIQRQLGDAPMPDDLNPNPAKTDPPAPEPAKKSAAGPPAGDLIPAADPLDAGTRKGAGGGIVAKKKNPTFNHTLLSLIAYAAGERGVDHGLAREVDAEVRKRSPWKEFSGVAVPMGLLMKAGSGAIGALAGGSAASTVGIEYLDSLFFAVDAAITLPLLAQKLGVSTIAATEETVRIPKLTGIPIPSWIARDGDLDDTQGAAFDSIEVKPKTVGCIVSMKRSALLYALHPDVQSIIPGELQKVMAVALDQAVLYGPGTLQPDGIISQSTAASSDLTDLASAYIIANDLIAYAKSDANARWALPNLAIGALSVTPAWTGALIPALQGASLAGYPFTMNVSAPSGGAGEQTFFFGDFSYTHLVVWDSVSLIANPFGSGFKSGAVELRIMADANVCVRDPKRVYRGNAAVLTA